MNNKTMKKKSIKSKSNIITWVYDEIIDLIDAVLPNVCGSCFDIIEKRQQICDKCLSEIEFIKPPFCKIMAIPFANNTEFDDIMNKNTLNDNNAISHEAMDNPPPWKEARAVFLYEGVGKNLIHGFKYSKRYYLRKILSEMMYKAGEDFWGRADLIVPVPLHYFRAFERSFNQSEVLAYELSKMTKIKSINALRRIRYTKQQASLTKLERKDNLQDAFKIFDRCKSIIRNKNIVLVDDVFTTGETLREVTRVLKRGKAKNIYVLTLGRATEAKDMTLL